MEKKMPRQRKPFPASIRSANQGRVKASACAIAAIVPAWRASVGALATLTAVTSLTAARPSERCA